MGPCHIPLIAISHTFTVFLFFLSIKETIRSSLYTLLSLKFQYIMEITSYLLAIAGAFVLVLLYNPWLLKIGSHKSKGMLAPEPSGALPIIGQLHKLGGQNLIARTLAAMAD